MPKVRTLYNPGVAMVYLITNLENGETIQAATCGIKDVDFKPWRSPKGTKQGEEFFKMKLGNKKDGFTSIKFMNSSKFNRCISDDGKWEFLGVRPDGGKLAKLTEQTPAIKIESQNINSQFESKRVKAIVEKIKDNSMNVSKVQIHAAISNEEFVDMDQMNQILK